jgi:acylphosphatase
MAGLKDTVCFIIHGRVQGVFYRDSTRKVARDLGIKGSAVNRSDGSVQVIAKGTPEVLKELKAWLRQGPEMALVENVEEVDIENQLEFNDFIIG